MKLLIDEEKREIVGEDGISVPLYSVEGYRLLSELWLKVGWDQKHPYTFTWLGRPIIQEPEDILRIQEVVYELKPDVIVETGVAHGGSLFLYASLCQAIGKGRVIGVDIEIRPHNRKAIEAHELFGLITLIEEDAVSEAALEAVAAQLQGADRVLVILDSNHSYDHVLKELEAYSRFVTTGSYIVATDGSQEILGTTPRAQEQYPAASGWGRDNPKRAAEDFVACHPDFTVSPPQFRFNESPLNFAITHWPSAFIQRKR